VGIVVESSVNSEQIKSQEYCISFIGSESFYVVSSFQKFKTMKNIREICQNYTELNKVYSLELGEDMRSHLSESLG
jgi:hypothetical protein